MALRDKRVARLATQRGSVLVEYGLYILIALIAIVALYAYFASGSSSEQAQTLRDDTVTLTARIKATYAGSYGAVSNASVDAAGMFAGLTSLADNAGSVSVTPGNGLLTVAPATLNVAGDAMQITLTQLPDAACLPLVTGIQANAISISVNATPVKTHGTPFVPANIRCAGDANTVAFVVM